jgi:DMSO reductase anchor subunit
VGIQLSGATDLLSVLAFVAVGLLVLTAVAVSTLHLGAPRHAPWAVANWRRSWLSREILGLCLLSALLAAGALVALLSEPAPSRASRTLIGVLAAASGLLVVGTMVRLYAVRTIPEWDARTTAVRFAGSTLRLGAVVAGILAAMAPGTGQAGLGPGSWLALLTVLGLGLEVAAGRRPRAAGGGRAGALLVRGIEPAGDGQMGRLMAGCVAAATGIILLVAGLPVLAVLVLLAALVALSAAEVALRDRFYALAPRRGRDVARPGHRQPWRSGER